MSEKTKPYYTILVKRPFDSDSNTEIPLKDCKFQVPLITPMGKITNIFWNEQDSLDDSTIGEIVYLDGKQIFISDKETILKFHWIHNGDELHAGCIKYIAQVGVFDPNAKIITSKLKCFTFSDDIKDITINHLDYSYNTDNNVSESDCSIIIFPPSELSDSDGIPLEDEFLERTPLESIEIPELPPELLQSIEDARRAAEEEFENKDDD